MRVLHVVIDGELAGGQLVARTLVDGQRARGHEVQLLSPARGPFTERAEHDGIRVHVVDVGRLHRLGGLARLVRLLRRERIELVHTHGAVASNVLGRIAARLAGARVVSHLHGANTFRDQPLARGLYRRLDNVSARLCSCVIAVSEDTRRRLLDQGYPPGLVRVVHNGIRVPEPRAGALAELGLRRPVVVCVGRIEPAKGQADLVRAAAEVPGATFLLVGRDVGGHRAEVERLAAELGVADRVVLTGPRADAVDLVAGCDVLAQPSWTEGFPIAPLEAMALGVPVVATAAGGTTELVEHGVTGLLVPPRRPDLLAAALLELLGDEARAARFGAAGRERVRERFDAELMVERVDELAGVRP